MIGPTLDSRARVLVRMPEWVGDFVLAEPALRALVAAQDAPGRVTVVGPEALLELYAPTSLAEVRRLPSATAPGDGRGGGWRGHDVAVLFPGSFRSAWTALRAGIPRRVGHARDLRGALLTDVLRPAREGGRPALGNGCNGAWPRILPRPYGATCVELLGLLGVPVSDPRPRLELRARDRERASARRRHVGFPAGGKLLLVQVGARPGSAKGVPAELWARAIERAEAELGLTALLACGPGELERVEAVRAACGRSVPALLEPVAGLMELAAHAAAARLVWTADGGARHVACAAGARLVVLFGPTDPRHSAGADVLTNEVRIEVACGPCHRERCPFPASAYLRCLRGIEPEALLAASRPLLV